MSHRVAALSFTTGYLACTCTAVLRSERRTGYERRASGKPRHLPGITDSRLLDSYLEHDRSLAQTAKALRVGRPAVHRRLIELGLREDFRRTERRTGSRYPAGRPMDDSAHRLEDGWREHRRENGEPTLAVSETIGRRAR
jgi:hypothetical protein